MNPNAINDADRGTARELLCITESAVDALNRSRSGVSANRDHKSDSSFVIPQAGNDVENLSVESGSSTASDILRRSTHTSAAFSFSQSVTSLPCSDEAARLVSIPVKVLREVPVPHDSQFSSSVPTSSDNFKTRVASQRKPGQLMNAVQPISYEATKRQCDKKVSQESEKMRCAANDLAVNIARTFRNAAANGMEMNDGMKQDELPVSSAVHPLKTILDNGYLTQPVHTIVPEKGLTSGDSQCSSLSIGNSASPIEVLAKDRETSEFFKFFSTVSCNVRLKIVAKQPLILVSYESCKLVFFVAFNI